MTLYVWMDGCASVQIVWKQEEKNEQPIEFVTKPHTKQADIGHCSVEMILCTETAFQEAIKIYTKYPIYSDQRESELCLSITWCLLFWILGKNKFHAKERTLKRTRRIVDTFTSKQTNKRRNRVPVIGCIRHEQVLGEWSVWH